MLTMVYLVIGGMLAILDFPAEIGYTVDMEKTVKIIMQELREQIAAEIEREYFFDATGQTPEYALMNIKKRCANIARGLTN